MKALRNYSIPLLIVAVSLIIMIAHQPFCTHGYNHGIAGFVLVVSGVTFATATGYQGWRKYRSARR